MDRLFVALASLLLGLPSIGQAERQDPQVTIVDAWRRCSANSDCIEVETLCSTCCGYDAIAKAHVEAFDAAKKKACAVPIGSFCNCVAAPGEPRCVRGACHRVLKSAAK